MGEVLPFPKTLERELQEATQAFSDGQPGAALVKAKWLIDRGHDHAFTLAGLACEGTGDHEGAFFYYRRAVATTGAVVAWLSLARLHLNGLGTAQDFFEARRCYEAVCEDADHGFAWLMLGSMHRLGLGGASDLAAARHCLDKAASKGFVLAYREIGFIEQQQGRRLRGFLYRVRAGMRGLAISLRHGADLRLRYDYLGKTAC